jgi:hypothetical protein
MQMIKIELDPEIGCPGQRANLVRRKFIGFIGMHRSARVNCDINIIDSAEEGKKRRIKNRGIRVSSGPFYRTCLRSAGEADEISN